MLIMSPIPSDLSRDLITKAYRMDETACINERSQEAALAPDQIMTISALAREFIEKNREYKKTQNKMESLLQQYQLSSEEGIALMCLAEALLRIPDNKTLDKFISDKLSNVDWTHLAAEGQSMFANAATWSLFLTGKVYSPNLDQTKSLGSSLKKAGSKLSGMILRPLIFKMMETMGDQFVLGQTINAALKKAEALTPLGYRFSFDMLGEAARTEEDAKRYYDAYVQAIEAIGQVAKESQVEMNPGISVKLSALHPRYEFAKRELMLNSMAPLLLSLAQKAKHYNIGLTVDAEEADRLDLSLDLIEAVFTHPSLKGWEGFGLAVQAYQKRALPVIEWIIDLGKREGKRMMVRLVKGAYWDAEIKVSQVLGLDYPVFTRKHATDVSYFACAKKMLAHPDCIYPQFGTHNAYTVATILTMADQNQAFEFQCLHGMGRSLYDYVLQKTKKPCRIYAPVGSHKELLGYLVRRLLENGANSSFIHQLADDKTPSEKLVIDPVSYMASRAHKPHPKIPTFQTIYGAWQNSAGIDLSNREQLPILAEQMTSIDQKKWMAASIVNGKARYKKVTRSILSPANTTHVLGEASDADTPEIDEALKVADEHKAIWANCTIDERAKILERAAILFQEAMPTFMTLLMREGGKCLPDAMSEVRETIDYCRYYAYRARQDLAPIDLPGPTGESNVLHMHPRGVIACISPWNFPLAIFCGQMLAALVAGNAVIAKPAEQTPIIAFTAVNLLHEAGVPKEALQLLIGPGRVIGPRVLSDTRISGVMFTGSTETAQSIQQTLTNRPGPITPFIAETGGQNAMIVDSTALPEQTVIDIAQSAFNSAGQRCSALRVLFVQEEIAPTLLSMLKGYMHTMNVGDPALLATDVGPVIDEKAKENLKQHVEYMKKEATLLAEVSLSHLNLPGHYLAPCAFELKELTLLKNEVFGPILHIIRYKANELEKVMQAIINTGFGLTLGVQSRISATIEEIVAHMPVGNMYVNRNTIGAVVGVQPFGGERLSGTGPKAGGPHYLPRLCVERTVSTNTTAVGGNARLVSLMEEEM